MIIIISLLILTVVFYILNRIFDDSIYFIFVPVTIILNIILLVIWLSQFFTYGVFETKRNSFVFTLNESRKQHRDLETAAIMKDVAQWNEDLAESQYYNHLFIIGDFVDDRIDSLKPIQ